MQNIKYSIDSALLNEFYVGNDLSELIQMSDLLDYKIEKLDEWDRTSEAYENYPENSFCIDYCSLLSEGGHLDDPKFLTLSDTNRGTRLDAWS